MLDSLRSVISDYGRKNEDHQKDIKNVIATTVRFDELLLQKASKISLQRLEKNLEEYVSK
jgi:hypothetical protein